MSRKDNEKKETKPRKSEETSIGREIWEYVKMIAIVVAVVFLWTGHCHQRKNPISFHGKHDYDRRPDLR